MDKSKWKKCITVYTKRLSNKVDTNNYNNNKYNNFSHFEVKSANYFKSNEFTHLFLSKVNFSHFLQCTCNYFWLLLNSILYIESVYNQVTFGFFLEVDKVMEVDGDVANILSNSRFSEEFTFQPQGVNAAASGGCWAKPNVSDSVVWQCFDMPHFQSCFVHR